MVRAEQCWGCSVLWCLVEEPLHTSAVKEKDEVRKERLSLFVKRRVAPVGGHMPRNLFSLAQAYLLDGEIIMVIR